LTVCVLAAATIIYLVVARFATRPLLDLASVANSIAAGDLGRRLAPTNTDSELGQMADAFDRMVDALEAALERAQAAEASTRRFIADASHELRRLGLTIVRAITRQDDGDVTCDTVESGRLSHFGFPEEATVTASETAVVEVAKCVGKPFARRDDRTR
jgi:methyl-accepting chemotaxis protein